MPLMIFAAAKFTDVMPDPQKRSNVTAEAEVSQPASNVAMRPTQEPCLPIWELQPTTTSSMSWVFKLLRAPMPSKTLASKRLG